MNIIIKTLAVFVLLLTSAFSFAEQKQVFGEYEVHYIGLTTSELDKNAAKLYGITRSRNLGYLMISVLKTGLGPMPVAWNAELDGTMSNLIGQQKDLEFTRIQETNALYFYTTFDFYDANMYRFHVKVKPEGQKRVFDLKFSQKFYRDE